ncbi:hypothetical protein BG005_002546 [Podila minutissima]|nr:hypothetical protein BG005_002546 [Podila minutissima]
MRSPLAKVKTVTHPLPSMLIDQATVVGNLEVLNTVMEKTLRLRQEWFDADRKILVAGDQLTVSRVSRAMDYKAIDISPYHRLQYALPMLQLFHLQMTFCGLILQTHWGSARQTGSLQFNKLLLKRKRVSLTDFDYHAADELLRHTFDAMVKRIWEVALENIDLAKAAVGLDNQQIKDLVSEKVTELAVYAAKGSNSSWDTLASSISVNIRTFSTIRKQFDDCFNRSHNSSHHSTVSAEADIKLLLSKFREGNILGEDLSAGDPDFEVTADKDLYARGISFLIESRIDAFRKAGPSDDVDEEEEEGQIENPFQ